MRRCLAVAVLAALVAGCSSSSSPNLPLRTSASSTVPPRVARTASDVASGQTQSLSFTGLGTAYAQTVTYDEAFEGEVEARSGNTAVATVDPPSERAAHRLGAGTKYATFTITPVAPGTTTVTITDKKGGTATVRVTVTGTNAFLAADLYNDLIEEFPAGAGSGTAPDAVLQAALQPRQIAVDATGNTYITSGSTLQVFAPSAASPARTIRGNLTQLNCAQSVAVDASGNAYVLNCGNIAVYGAGANGNVAPVRTLNVPNAGPGEGIGLDAAGELFVYNPNNGAGWINVYAPGASGSDEPVRRITSSALNGYYENGNIAVDGAGDVSVMVWGGPTTGAVVEFAAGSNGNVAPSAVNTTTQGYYIDSSSIAADAAGNVWLVARCNGLEHCVYEFAGGANGQATPLTSFVADGVQGSPGIAVGANGRLYLDDNVNDTIDTFASSSSGSAAPVYSVSLGVPGATQISQMALAPDGTLYTANSFFGVTAYASFVNGSPAPKAIIGNWPNYLQAQGVAVDGTGTLYVSDSNNGGSIDIYAPGNLSSPERTISGPSTGLLSPGQIAVAPNGNIIVGNRGNSTVTVYASGASGDVAPIAVIGGSNTHIAQTSAVGTDSQNNIYVGNGCCAPSNSVNVFTPNANGNVAPIRSLDGCGFAASLETDSAGYLYVACGGMVQIYAPGASGSAQPYRTIYQPASEGGFWYAIAIEP